MASTLAEMSRMALAHDFRHIDPRTARILLEQLGFFCMRLGLAFCPHIPRFFPSKRNATWRAWASRFSPTLVLQVWIRMEFSSADREFRPALYSGELVSLRLRRGGG